MPLTEKRMIWVDIENFGLAVSEDLLLEVGFVITDLELNMIDEHSVVIWDEPHYDRYSRMQGNPDESYVLNMHTENGLFAEAQSIGLGMNEAGQYIEDWIRSHGITKEEPMCGSSVQFDRERITHFWPRVASQFSYRNIDVSTLKEIASGYNPNVLKLFPKPISHHRSIPDCYDTINEFGIYLDNLVKADYVA